MLESTATRKKMAPPIQLRDRLTALNTKAYYLLVALSFLYFKKGESSLSLKIALGLTAIVACLPVQDWVNSDRGLEWLRRGKVLFLTIALVFTLWWVFLIS